MSPRLTGLRVADPPARWQELGFAVDGDAVSLGGVRVELGAEGEGITSWCLHGIESLETIDGLPTEVVDAASPADTPPHPNGAIGLDHVVIMTADFARTSAALADVGLPLRRVRQTPAGSRQGFRRLGPAILELVEAVEAGPGPARFWGLVVIVSDLEALADRLGEHVGRIKDAVQPGRRIATLRPSAGLGEAVAFMSPEADHFSPL